MYHSDGTKFIRGLGARGKGWVGVGGVREGPRPGDVEIHVYGVRRS